MLHKAGFILTIGIMAFAPAWADVLVTQDGETIETQGAWRVKGRQVVFTSLKGVLSSMRLSEVDVEASHEATRKANEPPPETEPGETIEQQAEPKKASVLKLTNDNVGDGRGNLSGDAAEVGREIGEAMGEAMAGLTEGMISGLVEGFGGEAQAGEAGEQIAEGMAQGFEAMGEFMAAAVEIGTLAAEVDAEHDLDTPEGMRAAAPDFARLATEARRRGGSGSPEYQEAMAGFATQLQEFADLARQNPEAAVEMRRKGMEENAQPTF